MKVTGELREIGTMDGLFDPVHTDMFVKHGSDVVGHGKVDADYRFEIEIPDALTGELEVHAAAIGAAPVVFEAGEDIELIVLINRGGSNSFV